MGKTVDELATQIVQTIKDIPGIFKGIVNEIENLFYVIVVRNAKEMMEVKTEDEFWELMAKITDMLIPLPQPWETLDGPLLNLLFKRVVAPLVNKYAGDNFMDKLRNLVLTKTSETSNVTNA